MGQYGHITLVWVSWYETKVFHGLIGCQRDTPVLGRHRIQVLEQLRTFAELKHEAVEKAEHSAGLRTFVLLRKVLKCLRKSAEMC